MGLFKECPPSPRDLIPGSAPLGSPLGSGNERTRIFSALPEVLASGMCISQGWVLCPTCDTVTQGGGFLRFPGPSSSSPSPWGTCGALNRHSPTGVSLHLPVLCLQGPRSRRSPHAGSSGKKAKAQELGDQPVDRPQEAPWTYFCDFQDITHVVLREHHASIHCQDKSLVGPKAGAGLRAGWGAPPGYDACLTSPWPLGADPAFPGHRPVLGVTGGWLLPPDGRLQPLPVPRGGSSTAGDECPGRHPWTPAVSTQEGGCAARAMVVAAAR